MAAKFQWFRAEKSKAGRILDGRQFTVQFNDCSHPEMSLANGFFHCEALIVEGGQNNKKVQEEEEMLK